MMLTYPNINGLGGLTLLALRRGKSGGSGGDDSSGDGFGETNDPKPPIPKRVIAAVVLGLLLLFAGILVFVISGGEPPEPTITGSELGLNQILLALF